MDLSIVGIVVAVTALAISGLQFYYTHVRNVQKLLLIRIDKLGMFTTPMFALVNVGTTDVLITSIMCGFRNDDTQSRMYPSQRVVVGHNQTLLISSGDAIQCTIEIDEKFTKTFVMGGKVKSGSVPPIYQHLLFITVDWVDMTGNHRSVEVDFCKYGFRDDGAICHFSPLKKQTDLYHLQSAVI